MRIIRYLAAALFILSIPVAIVTTNIRFLANEPRVYRYAIDQYDAVQTTGIQRDELIRAGAELRDYFNNDQAAPSIHVEQAGREVSLFNDRETAHMVDVKQRFQQVNRLQVASLLYMFTYVVAVVLWAKELSPRGLALQAAAGGAILLAVLGIVGAIGATGFDSAWVDFHELLFSGNDFWRLNPATDHLIQMFPPAFWENIVFMLGLMVGAEAGLLLIVSGLYFGASRHAESRRLQPYYA